MKRAAANPLLIVTLALIAALVACVFGTATEEPAESSNLVTVTPGGRVSVSLLTPTITIDNPAVAGSTPIGPVATATAAAQAAIDMTATAQVPIPTVPGVFVEPAVCPAAANVALPGEPSNFTNYPEVIVQYLSAGGAPTILEARLRAWGAITDYGGLVRADRDFTGDGVPDVLIVALDPFNTQFPYPGDLFIFGCENGAYRLLLQAGHSSKRGMPLIYSADDVNGDALNDLVYAVQICETTPCRTEMEIMSWNLALSSFTSLLSEPVSGAGIELSMEDEDGDGLDELAITDRGDGLPESGPQRVYTTTLRWNGSLYTTAEVVPWPLEYRIHFIQDGDAAQRQGDFLTASDFYNRALDDDLLNWTYEDEKTYLKAYARYRLMIGYAVQNDKGRAREYYDKLDDKYDLEGSGDGEQPTLEPGTGGMLRTPIPPPTLAPAPPPYTEQAGGGFAEMARLFWAEYDDSGDIAKSCAAVIAFAAAEPKAYEVLNSFGTANPSYRPEDLCPFPN
ncbi:MAG: hypothetical protein JXJ17_00940 [Anaerolineae bacterium]|nr:hypothetical protein [Anaerolineae bacterium]